MNLRFKTVCITKATLIAGLLALAWFNTSGQFAAQEPKSRSFTYSLTGEAWLVVARSNNAEDSDWNPSYVNAVSTYRPVVVKRGNKWEVTFRSPNLPEPELP